MQRLSNNLEMNTFGMSIRRLRDRFRPTKPPVNEPALSPEVLFISYPKTGRTWLRMMIGKYLCLRYSLDDSRILETPYLTDQAGVRIAQFVHDGASLKKMTSSRTLEQSKQAYRFQRVLLLTRGIEDTMVSAYFQVTRRLKVFRGTISEMLRDERFGAQKFIAYYEGWYRQRDVPIEFAEISYEVMHADPHKALREALVFLGEKAVDINQGAWEAAVEYASFENMKGIERSQELKQGAMQPANPRDPNSHKVRRGVVGGYVDYLPPEDIAYIRELAAASDCPWIRTATS